MKRIFIYYQKDYYNHICLKNNYSLYDNNNDYMIASIPVIFEVIRQTSDCSRLSGSSDCLKNHIPKNR